MDRKGDIPELCPLGLRSLGPVGALGEPAARPLVPSLLKKPVPWVPPPGQQAPYRPAEGLWPPGEWEQMQPPGSLCTAGNQPPGREFAYGGLFGTKAVP